MTTSRKLEKTNDNTEILFKALCNYLPYKVKIKDNYGWQIMEGLNDTCVNPTHEEPAYFDEVCKPILRPLLDLNHKSSNIFKDNNEDMEFLKQDNTHLSNAMIIELIKKKGLLYRDFEYLLSKHYDLFDLIPQKLAIDINTLDKK